MVIHVDQSGDARTPVIVDRIRLLAQTRPGEVANRFRAILIAARRGHPIDLRHQFIVEHDRHALHGGIPNQGVNE